MTKQILLIGSAPEIDFPYSLRVGQSDITFSSSARNISVILDSQLTLKEQSIYKLCQLVYLKIRRTGSL